MKAYLTLVLLSLSFLTLAQSIEGRVADVTTKKPIVGAQIRLSLITDSFGNKKNFQTDIIEHLIDSTISDINGDFKLFDVNPNEYSLSCLFTQKDKTVKLGDEFYAFSRYERVDSLIIRVNKKENVNFSLLVVCPYDKTKNRSSCPNCKKRDKVKPYYWGLPHYDGNGFVYDRKGIKVNLDNYYPGGCSPDLWCNPSKHCDRCDLSF